MKKKNSIIIAKMLKSYYKIFLIPESMIVFVSGIFISTSTGILTCVIPEPLYTIGVWYILSAISMFISSVFMMIWAILIKPIHETYVLDNYYGRKGKKDWYSFFSDQQRKKIRVKLNICLTSTVILLIFNILVWGFSC